MVVSKLVVEGYFTSVQCDGLRNGSNRCTNQSSSELLSVAQFACADHCSEACDVVHLLSEGDCASQVRVSSPRLHIEAPGREILVQIFGSLRHSCILNGFICKASVTLVTILEERWKDCQELCLGRGNRQSNKVSNSSVVLHSHSFLYPKDRDATSAIRLSSPAT